MVDSKSQSKKWEKKFDEVRLQQEPTNGDWTHSFDLLKKNFTCIWWVVDANFGALYGSKMYLQAQIYGLESQTVFFFFFSWIS